MKEVRSKFVKKSLLDYENIANSLKENTSDTVRNILGEEVRNTYNQILAEANEDEDEYEVENDEVDDTKSDSDDEPNDADVDTSKEDSDEGLEEDSDEEADINSDDELSSLDDTEESDDESNDDWAEFDKYKVSDDEYDFSEANDDEIVKVYKLLKDDDKVLVNVDKESKKVELKDNETDAEYIIDISGVDEDADDMDIEDDSDLNFDENNMTNESRIFEIALNEYDSPVGYTDSYQKKNPIITPNMSEPGKNVNDWDAGVPKGASKPWAGKKGDSKPFGMIDEDEDMLEDGYIEDDEAVEEGTNVGGFVQQNSTSKSHVPSSNGRNARNASRGGSKIKGTSNPRYSAGATNESKMVAKVNKILAENNELKKALTQFKTVLQEAAVTNVSLGQIIKLISENSTTKSEKQEIIARFGKEAKTVQDAKNLYESISRELRKNNTMNIDEGKQFTATSSKMINETQIYKSQDVDETLDLMRRVCNK